MTKKNTNFPACKELIHICFCTFSSRFAHIIVQLQQDFFYIFFIIQEACIQLDMVLHKSKQMLYANLESKAGDNVHRCVLRTGIISNKVSVLRVEIYMACLFFSIPTFSDTDVSYRLIILLIRFDPLHVISNSLVF